MTLVFLEDILKLLPDTDTVGLKPSGFRQKLAQFPKIEVQHMYDTEKIEAFLEERIKLENEDYFSECID